MIDLQELRNSLTSEDIIDIISKLGGDEYVDKDDYIIFKTICHHKHAENGSMKLYYYKNSKTFHCYTQCSCNFTIYELFKKRYELLNKDYNFYYDIVLPLAKGRNISNSDITSFFIEYKSDFDKYNKNNIKVEIPILPTNLLNIYSPCAAPEWINDGISVETMRRHNILYSIDENKIIIPHYNINGDLIGIRGRALNKEDVEKGKYRPVQIEDKILSHPLGYNLYGLDKNKENIKRFKIAIVAEAEKSVLQYETMYDKNSNIVVAACGSNFSTYQFNLLYKLGIEKIILAFDKEGENWKEVQKYYNKLKRICNNYKNKVQMGFIWDKQNLLNLKDSPFDKGKEVFERLYKGVEWT